MKRKPFTTLVTGGARSGKSRYALEAAMTYRQRVMIATAVAFDDEMRERIRNHQAEREGAFVTIEEPLDPAGALERLPPGTDVAVIDCLTVWLGNLMHNKGPATDVSLPEIRSLIGALKAPPCDLIVVTNEVGMGIIPENGMARRFRDLAGRLNSLVAGVADRVIFMVSGIAMVVKGEDPPPVGKEGNRND